MPKKNISKSVIRRLPRYYRFLGELLKEGINKISSHELAERMRLTASQIRQDLNCFGGFGQQGYGYNVDVLREEIGQILGVDSDIPAILVGSGTRGQSLVRDDELFTRHGFTLIAAFDVAPEKIGMKLPTGLVVKDIAELEDFCREHHPKMAVVCIPREEAEKMADTLIELGINSFWNFSSYDFNHDFENISMVNVHLGDRLLTLSYRATHPKTDEPARRIEK